MPEEKGRRRNAFLPDKRTFAFTVGISVITYNRPEITFRCIQQLRQHTAHPFFLTVIDNGSETPMREALQRLASDGVIDSLILHKRNMGVSVAANTGWQNALCPFYIKMDNDILIRDASWLDSILELCREEKLSAAAFKLCSWHASRPAVSQSGRQYEITEALGGGCILVPAPTHEALGFWNEDYVYGWEDLEYSNRIRLCGGSLACLEPEGIIEHLGADDPVRRTAYHQSKQQMAGDLTGPESLFLLNTAMFEMNLRPLRVERKYLPIQDADGFVSYAANPEYAFIVNRQKIFKERFVAGYTKDGFRIKTDNL